ncbi:MAG TPA: 5-formyltetrahydrofolate cyclo-ligase [Bauldia sp.]|nr:5-formyltetrahydrofolate cyclo-ligase [Bauldia sp.]
MTAPPAAIVSKDTLRAEAMARRDTITAADRADASAAIAERVTSLAAVAGARSIGAYLPIWSEVETRDILDWAFARDIEVALPAVIDAMTFVYRRWQKGDALLTGRFGTRAPGDDAQVLAPDVIITPMVAFDRRGTRLGHGRGYYDRAVAGMRAGGHEPLLVGVAFAAQEVADIPSEPHDIGMHFIVTERETLALRKG